MTCYHPLQAYFGRDVLSSGKHKIVFDRRFAIGDGVSSEVLLPCGQCVGCRLERSRQWAVRCMHEAQMYERNCFITLTFRDEDLPDNLSLDVTYFQRFMKRLRFRFGDGIRFFHCGEYGEKYGRPHYHACLFNFDFDDKVLFKDVNGIKLYTSKSLEELWPFGFCTIGDVTFESAAYVARYIMKKVTGDRAKAHYERVDVCTGEVVDRKPEYTTMSRRPGIGKLWYDSFKDDVYPHDHVIVRGKECRPPKYYDSLFEIEYPEDYAKLKLRRKTATKQFADNNTPERLHVREQVKLSRVKLLKRSVDSEI